MQRVTPEIFRNQWCCFTSGFSNRVVIGVLPAPKCTNLVGSVPALQLVKLKEVCACVSIKEKKKGLKPFAGFFKERLVVLQDCTG